MDDGEARQARERQDTLTQDARATWEGFVCSAAPIHAANTSLRLYATSLATEMARVENNRRERTNPKVDPGGSLYFV
jgi:hypothetical protein